MALPTAETLSRVASESAQSFVEHFYDALDKRRPLAPFYASTSARLAGAGVKPDISINGKVLSPDGGVAEYEAMLDAQGRPVAYEVTSFDAHPVVPHYVLGEPDPAGGSSSAKVKDGDAMSFAVQVSGVVKYGRGGGGGGANSGAKDGRGAIFGGGSKADVVEKGFNEAFLLVPHWEAWARNAPRNLRKWVIVSQNFRAL
ncbi:hypothetical protein GGS23DRAFT_169485 [Durotheca rogersii]|uniref:uncharacterized protein n=1 Tax=Durotheca rogersii TaxID=419775 RepID=UPI00221E5FB1|nr:uncharacterized protein GGS23DRAFT_169485 [Durotheca rogersii]KAI5867298.1 hypothetical protein GGS23DRAFT_169485 [Durotheca rogersii]